ncbi:MAG TPA: hypothetical protein VIO38_13290, partial [Rariglobus sp.]
MMRGIPTRCDKALPLVRFAFRDHVWLSILSDVRPRRVSNRRGLMPVNRFQTLAAVLAIATAPSMAL